jgi:hypothetical protein
MINMGVFATAFRRPEYTKSAAVARRGEEIPAIVLHGFFSLKIKGLRRVSNPVHDRPDRLAAGICTLRDQNIGPARRS